jgi:hypothetical protein
MGLHRVRKYRLLSWGLVPLCVLILVTAWVQGQARADGAGASQGAGSQGRLRELMTQRYELLKSAVANSERLLQKGLGDTSAHRKLTVALYRAEADLCPTPAERVKVYEKLVDSLAAQQGSLERLLEAGRASLVQVAQGQLVIIEARIDLERLRLGQPVSQW